MRALTYVLLHWVRSVPMLMLFAVLFGFVDYSVVPPTVSLVETHMGSGTVGLGVGVLLRRYAAAAVLLRLVALVAVIVSAAAFVVGAEDAVHRARHRALGRRVLRRGDAALPMRLRLRLR